jgi:hypothetical protein
MWCRFDLKKHRDLKYFFKFAPLFVTHIHTRAYMVVVAQLVRALDCGSRGRRFDPGLPPKAGPCSGIGFFLCLRLFPGTLKSGKTTSCF